MSSITLPSMAALVENRESPSRRLVRAGRDRDRHPLAERGDCRPDTMNGSWRG
jgi:hypothetical protein